MPDEISFSFDLGEIETALRNLPAKVGVDIIRTGLQAAGDVILQSMVSHCPERTDAGTPGSDALPPGFLRADLHTEIQVKPGFAPRVKVGPSKYTSHVANWVENGFQPTSHGKRKNRKSLGERVPGKHFMAAASDETRESAAQALLSSLASSLNFSNEGIGAETEYGGEDY